MIPEILTTPLVQYAVLALKPAERWSAARSPLQDSFSAEQWSTAVVIIAQVISMVIILWLFTKKGQVEQKRRRDMAGLTATNEELTREIDELTQRIQSLISEESPSEELEGAEEVRASQASAEETEEAGEPTPIKQG